MIAIVVVAVAVVVAAVLLWVVRRPRRDASSPAASNPAAPKPLPPDAEPESGAAAASDRARLAGALAGLTDGVVVAGADGAILYRNPAAERFGRARHADVLVEDAIRDLLDRARRGEVGERELQLFGPPREILAIRAVPLHADGTVVGAAAYVRDVSEVRRVESIRRDFVTNVSHELKTPIGALALLAETMAGTSDLPVLRQLAQRVEREADRLSRIVDDLLDLSIIEAQEAPAREVVPAAALAEEAVDRVRATGEAAAIPIDARIDTDAAVRCDRRQMLSALVNLLENAVKYSDPGSPVTMRVHEDGDRVVFVVEDRGIGIPTRDLERIFERFYRVDRARSRATGGTGLGLSIVRHVAQAHGGDVSVRSREGEGSAFALSIPSIRVGESASHAGTPERT